MCVGNRRVRIIAEKSTLFFAERGANVDGRTSSMVWEVPRMTLSYLAHLRWGGPHWDFLDAEANRACTHEVDGKEGNAPHVGAEEESATNNIKMRNNLRGNKAALARGGIHVESGGTPSRHRRSVQELQFEGHCYVRQQTCRCASRTVLGDISEEEGWNPPGGREIPLGVA